MQTISPRFRSKGKHFQFEYGPTKTFTLLAQAKKFGSNKNGFIASKLKSSTNKWYETNISGRDTFNRFMFVLVSVPISYVFIFRSLLFPYRNLQVVLTHQFLVRPTNGQTGDKEPNNKKDRTNTTDSATSTASTNTDTAQQSTPEFSFAETVLQKVGKPLKDVIQQVSIEFIHWCNIAFARFVHEQSHGWQVNGLWIKLNSTGMI